MASRALDAPMTGFRPWADWDTVRPEADLTELGQWPLESPPQWVREALGLGDYEAGTGDPLWSYEPGPGDPFFVRLTPIPYKVRPEPKIDVRALSLPDRLWCFHDGRWTRSYRWEMVGAPTLIDGAWASRPAIQVYHGPIYRGPKRVQRNTSDLGEQLPIPAGGVWTPPADEVKMVLAPIGRIVPRSIVVRMGVGDCPRCGRIFWG